MNFKKGLHVTYTNPKGIKHHGTIEKVRDDSPYPLLVFIKAYGLLSFTLDGRFVEDGGIGLKIRDEI